jgi:hypothetical protein
LVLSAWRPLSAGRIRLPRTLSWYCLAAWFAWAGLSGLAACAALSGDVVFKGRTLLEKFCLAARQWLASFCA